MSASGEHETVTIDVIASALLVKARQVQVLASSGIIPRPAKGQYQLIPSIQGYIKHLRDGGRRSDGKADELGPQKVRLYAARARAAEVEADVLDGSAIPRSHVEAAWLDLVTRFRSRMLALPTSVAPLVISATSIAESSAIMTDAVHDALRELATIPVYRTDPPSSQASAATGGAEGDDGLDAADEDDGIGVGGPE